MRARDADIVVVGAGITGVATARALAQGGRGVLLLEQYALGHDRGSSHGRSRIFRLSYPDAHHVRLAQAALDAWRELEAECGERLIVHSGTLDIGRIATENARALAACGARYETLGGSEAVRRWPLAIEPGERVLYQPDGGTTLADRAHAAFVAAARAAGAEIVEHARVLGLEPGRGVVHLRTERSTVTARSVVVAAGAWSQALTATAGIELPVVPTRETVAYFHLAGALELPAVMDDATPDANAHGLLRPGLITYALAAPGMGLKAGLHHAGPPADPDADGTPDEAVVRWVSSWVARRYPEADPSPTGSETCLYTNTADESFVLERHGRVVVASACSGHGFKFAPVLGRTIAAMARDAAG